LYIHSGASVFECVRTHFVPEETDRESVLHESHEYVSNQEPVRIHVHRVQRCSFDTDTNDCCAVLQQWTAHGYIRWKDGTVLFECAQPLSGLTYIFLHFRNTSVRPKSIQVRYAWDRKHIHNRFGCRGNYKLSNVGADPIIIVPKTHKGMNRNKQK